MKNKTNRFAKSPFSAAKDKNRPSKDGGHPRQGAAAKPASPKTATSRDHAEPPEHASRGAAEGPHRATKPHLEKKGDAAPFARKKPTAESTPSAKRPSDKRPSFGSKRMHDEGVEFPKSAPKGSRQRFAASDEPFAWKNKPDAPLKQDGDSRPATPKTKPAAQRSKTETPEKAYFAASGKAAHAARPATSRTQETAKPSRKEAPAAKIQASHPTRPAHSATADRHSHDRANVRSGQTLELAITSVNDDGFGVSYHEGTRILVAHALPGEQVVVRVTYVGKREAFGNILKCLKSSPDRVDVSPCSKGRVCDGCNLMQMRYPAQLAWKRELVAKQLRQYPSLTLVPVHDTIASPQEFGYRNSAKLVVSGKSAAPVIGMYRRNSHDVQENLDCPLHHPLINRVVQAAKAGIKKGKVPIYNPKSEMGLLRYLVVRVAQPGDRVMVVLVTSEVGYNEMHHLAKYIQQEVPEVAVVAQNINNTTGNVIFGQRDRFLTKGQTLRAKMGETTFSLSPRSFFQVNSGAAQIIYERVRKLAALKGTERVIDLYCGIGGISLLLAKDAAEVVGIELVEAAVTDATENARLNRIDNCEFVAGDAARLLDEIGSEGGADVIVLNPPRKGCEEKVLKSAAALNPGKMIYVSCSPETLARDLDLLSRLGYRTVEVQPVDMFPQTVHVEDVALLEKI